MQMRLVKGSWSHCSGRASGTSSEVRTIDSGPAAVAISTSAALVPLALAKKSPATLGAAMLFFGSDPAGGICQNAHKKKNESSNRKVFGHRKVSGVRRIPF